VIEDYEPDDRAWGVVIGPFVRPKPEAEEPLDEDAEEQPPET
jgi:hypothetical protein